MKGELAAGAAYDAALRAYGDGAVKDDDPEAVVVRPLLDGRVAALNAVRWETSPRDFAALVLRPGMDPKPLLQGGGQERRRRAGTENGAGIAGMGLAPELALDHPIQNDPFQTQIEASLPPGAQVAAAADRRVSTITCAVWPGKTAERMLMKFDLKGVALSSGSACSSGKVGASHVLTAMGFDTDQALSAVRFSTGWNTTQAEVHQLIDAIRSMA